MLMLLALWLMMTIIKNVNMKKFYLIFIAMAILLAGCMMATEKQAEGIYEESVLSLDTILVLEEVQPIYALESAPIMEVEMVEERSMAMKTMVEPDTLIKEAVVEDAIRK